MLTVIATATDALPGVTVLGLKLQSVPAGAPEQEKLTGLENDEPTGKTLKLYAADWPCATVRVLGVIEPREKSCPAARVIVAEWDGLPVTSCAVITML